MSTPDAADVEALRVAWIDALHAEQEASDLWVQACDDLDVVRFAYREALRESTT